MGKRLLSFALIPILFLSLLCPRALAEDAEGTPLPDSSPVIASGVGEETVSAPETAALEDVQAPSVLPTAEETPAEEETESAPEEPAAESEACPPSPEEPSASAPAEAEAGTAELPSSPAEEPTALPAEEPAALPAEETTADRTEGADSAAPGPVPVENEYLFYAGSAEEAAAVSASLGYELLDYTGGIAVVRCQEPPREDCGVRLYQQFLYTIQSFPLASSRDDAAGANASGPIAVDNPGKGVVVAVVDSGVDLDHPALSGSLLDAVSVIPSSEYEESGRFSGLAADAQDNNGHGSHVAGIIAGGEGIGLAPEARLLSIKALERNKSGSASGTSSWIAAAVRYALSQNVSIINLSVGTAKADAVLADAIAQAAQAGVLAVCATGNYSGESSVPVDTILYPAAYEGALAVTSVSSDGEISSISRYGEGTDLAAEGENVYSCIQNGGYAYLSGTSMASAYVSGAAALLKSQFPDLSAEELTTLMKETARDLGAEGYDTVYGWGLVDLAAALDKMQKPQAEEPAEPAADPAAPAQPAAEPEAASPAGEQPYAGKPALPQPLPADGDNEVSIQETATKPLPKSGPDVPSQSAAADAHSTMDVSVGSLAVFGLLALVLFLLLFPSRRRRREQD